MIQSIKLLQWQFILLLKNNIITISAAVTFIYGLIFYVIKSMGNLEKVLVFMLYNDTVIIGLFFMGISVIIEKNQQVLTALFVTPIRLHQYLITRILSLSIVGWLCAFAMAFFAVGSNFNWWQFSMGVFNVCVLSCLAGLWLVSYTSEVLLFLLKSIPVLLLMVAPPLFNYLEVTNVTVFGWFPVQGSLFLIDHAFTNSLSNGRLIYSYISIITWPVLIYYFAYQAFNNKIIKQ